MRSKLLKKAFKADNLERSWQVIRDNGRQSQSEDTRRDIAAFADEAPANLRRLQRRLSTGKFVFGPSKGIPIQKKDGRGRLTGKVRPIVLAPVESRIVQRALLNVLLDVPALARFVDTPYSFGGIRKKSKSEQRRTDNLSGVPAAIKRVLDGIAAGSRYFVVADISGFFTKISKKSVRAIVSDAVLDDEFMKFFDKAIAVELANMAALRGSIGSFPIEDIGVAQGNSLSPLLGNILLHEFDAEMNSGDCACVRYIDDFIILAPTEAAANARLRKARVLLGAFDMELALEKTGTSAAPVKVGIEFLGIEICPGFIRPSPKAQQKLLTKIGEIFDHGRKALVEWRDSEQTMRFVSLLDTLRLASATVDGWGKHYWFCNDGRLLVALDERIWNKAKAYLGCYSEVRGKAPDTAKAKLLGLAELTAVHREPFDFPSL